MPELEQEKKYPVLVSTVYSFLLTMLCIEAVNAGITGRFCREPFFGSAPSLLEWILWPFVFFVPVLSLPIPFIGTVVGALVGQSISPSRRANIIALIIFVAAPVCCFALVRTPCY